MELPNFVFCQQLHISAGCVFIVFPFGYSSTESLVEKLVLFSYFYSYFPCVNFFFFINEEFPLNIF